MIPGRRWLVLLCVVYHALAISSPEKGTIAEGFRLESLDGNDLLLDQRSLRGHDFRRRVGMLDGVRLRFSHKGKAFDLRLDPARSIFEATSELHVASGEDVVVLSASDYSVPTFRSENASLILEADTLHGIVAEGPKVFVIEKHIDTNELQIFDDVDHAHGSCHVEMPDEQENSKAKRGLLHNEEEHHHHHEHPADEHENSKAKRRQLHNEEEHHHHHEHPADEHENAKAERRLLHDEEEHHHHVQNPALQRRNLVYKFDDCYPGQDQGLLRFDIGMAMDSFLFRRLGGTVEAATKYIQELVNDANVVYTNQVGVLLSVGNVYIQTDEEGAPAWNFRNPDESCRNTPDILTDFKQWEKPSQQGVWHALRDCPHNSVSGISVLRSLCDHPSNVGITVYKRAYATSVWLVFAHEIGHNFGATHTFQNGVGHTGGIMDYGNGLFHGEYQFIPEYSKDEICTELSQALNASCPHFIAQVPSMSPTVYSDFRSTPTTNPALPPSSATIMYEVEIEGQGSDGQEDEGGNVVALQKGQGPVFIAVVAVAAAGLVGSAACFLARSSYFRGV